MRVTAPVGGNFSQPFNLWPVEAFDLIFGQSAWPIVRAAEGQKEDQYCPRYGEYRGVKGMQPWYVISPNQHTQTCQHENRRNANGEPVLPRAWLLWQTERLPLKVSEKCAKYLRPARVRPHPFQRLLPATSCCEVDYGQYNCRRTSQGHQIVCCHGADAVALLVEITLSRW